MRLGLYALYWIVLGPLLFIVSVDILIYPAGLIAHAMWGEPQPTLVRIAIGAFSLLALIIGCCVVWSVWCRFQSFVLIHTGSSRMV